MASTRARLQTPAEIASRTWRRQQEHASATYRSFLQELGREADIPKDSAEAAAISVLCALEQHLLLSERRDLEAQLPSKLRELVRRCDEHRNLRPRRFGRARFLRMVAEHMGSSPEQVEPAVLAVLRVMSRRISRGEIEDVLDELPEDLRALWGDVAAAKGAEAKAIDSFRRLPIDGRATVLKAAVADTMRQLNPEARRSFWWHLSEGAFGLEQGLSRQETP